MFETGAGRAASVDFSYSREPLDVFPRRRVHWQKSLLTRAYFPFIRWA